MGDTPRTVWTSMSQLFPPDKEATRLAGDLFREYETKGFLGQSSSFLAGIPFPVLVDFFRRASLMYSSEKPILRRRDTRWMSQIDYTEVNVRATGFDKIRGNFLTAAFYLTTLRVGGCVLAPITTGPGEDLNFLGSHSSIRMELTHPEALAAGFGPDLQLTALVEAAHLLGLVLGYELDYRISPQAAVIFHRPDLFSWVRRGEEPDYQEDQREILLKEVREVITTQQRREKKLDLQKVQVALENAGLSPCLSGDKSGRACFSFFKNAGIREEAVLYWGRIFDKWRDSYSFDFLMLRIASTKDSEEEVPNKAVIRQAVELIRKQGTCPNLGVMLEGEASEVENYGVQGVDLVLENDGGSKVDQEWMERNLLLDKQLHRINLGRKLLFSVFVPVDMGERESQSRWERINLKRFIGRFLGVGPSRRPLFESMGAGEGTWGYAQTLKSSCSLNQSMHPGEVNVGRWIENLARVHADFLRTGERLDQYVDSRMAWWIIRSRRGLLIAVVSLENQDLLPPLPLTIDYGIYLKNFRNLTLLEYNFKSSLGNLILTVGTTLKIENLPYRGFRLYVLT